jgi:hypothetical protein
MQIKTVVLLYKINIIMQGTDAFPNLLLADFVTDIVSSAHENAKIIIKSLSSITNLKYRLYL